MKDAIVAEHSDKEIQTVVVQTTPFEKSNWRPTGGFAPGNKIHELSSKGRGFAKISSRVEAILEREIVADINYATERGRFEMLNGADAVAYRRARNAVYGLGSEAQDVVDRIDGPVAKTVQHSGIGGAPIAVVTADCTELLVAALAKKE